MRRGIELLWTLSSLAGISCSGPSTGSTVLTADLPLHFEAHLDDATVNGSEVPADVPQPVEWRFDEPQPGWKAVTPRPFPAGIRPAAVSQTDEALRIALGPLNAEPGDWLVGGAYADVPEWDHPDWAHVVIRARSTGPGNLILAFNVWRREGHPNEGAPYPYEMRARGTPIVGDSAVQTYRLPLEPSETWDEPIRQLGLWIVAGEPLEIDILSITVVPTEASYAEEPAGMRETERGQLLRRALFVHTPARLEYRVRVPEGGRLDLGLGTLRPEPATTFRVTVRPEGAPADTLLEESYADHSAWAQRSVDLRAYEGRVVLLSLEAESERDGSLALWGAPTLTGPRTTDKPNVIFYIIDGAGAEYLSVYGYNRRTTPNLERLAAEGALFERAYSNASWTRPSTASFMTSLQHSVLGGAKAGFNVVPDNALTMAQHFHRAGYQTGVFTANPNAGKMSGLEREVDSFREGWTAFSYWGNTRNWKQSSSYLHAAFWNWRQAYPAEPYWVHFQTVDIHGDFPAPAPFGGLFVGSEPAKDWNDWRNRFWEAGGDPYSGDLEEAGIDRVEFYTVMQGLYDEAMAYNDYQIGRLVERLEAEGEWENTLLVIGADHSITAAAGDVGVLIQDSLPPPWNNPFLRPSISRVPLLFVWPGHIAGGQRFSQPVVSMIDVLPTILDLAGLAPPEVMQGQSLAPLLLGEGGVERRPVILDEFFVDPETGELRGTLEVVDGRWGASLEINPEPPEDDEDEEAAMSRRPVSLLLYDLWNDPMCLRSVHEEHPDLVEKYTAFLEAQFEAHEALGQLFTPGKDVVLTPEQLEMLRTLGYIR